MAIQNIPGQSCVLPAPMEQKDIISLVPKEIALKILQYLPLISLVRASEVCKHWKVLATIPALWNTVCLRMGISSHMCYKQVLAAETRLHLVSIKIARQTIQKLTMSIAELQAKDTEIRQKLQEPKNKGPKIKNFYTLQLENIQKELNQVDERVNILFHGLFGLTWLEKLHGSTSRESSEWTAKITSYLPSTATRCQAILKETSHFEKRINTLSQGMSNAWRLLDAAKEMKAELFLKIVGSCCPGISTLEAIEMLVEKLKQKNQFIPFLKNLSTQPVEIQKLFYRYFFIYGHHIFTPAVALELLAICQPIANQPLEFKWNVLIPQYLSIGQERALLDLLLESSDPEHIKAPCWIKLMLYYKENDDEKLVDLIYTAFTLIQRGILPEQYQAFCQQLRKDIEWLCNIPKESMPYPSLPLPS